MKVIRRVYVGMTDSPVGNKGSWSGWWRRLKNIKGWKMKKTICALIRGFLLNGCVTFIKKTQPGK
jgi:hypothetical protein